MGDIVLQEMIKVRASMKFIRDTLGDNLTGAEIGVWQGKNAYTICKYLKLRRLYCVDSWEKDYLAKRPVRRWIAAEDAYRTTKKRLKLFPEVKLMRMTSRRASQRIEHGELDFVYIDGDHSYEAVKNDLEMWHPKVRVGGIVAGHDFGYKMAPGVVPAVFKHVYKNNLKGYFQDKDWWFVNTKELSEVIDGG